MSLIYVDDILLASNNNELLHEIKQKLMHAFEMTDLGEPKCFLGMNIERNRESRVTTINQKKFIDKILFKFGFENKFS